MRKLMLFFILCISTFVIKGQVGICSNPKTVSDGSCTSATSTTFSPYYFKFSCVANHAYTIKLYIQNYSNDPSNYSVKVYENNCGNIPNNSVPINNWSNGDTLFSFVEQITGGNDYLIELTNHGNGGNYNTTFDLCLRSITNSSVLATCPSSITIACDLVCNGTFENAVSTPTSFGSISSFYGWTSANAGFPDALSNSATLVQVQVPCNMYGYENSKSTGGNYAGIFCSHPSTATFTPWNEAVETQLIKTMQPGYRYQVSVWVSEGDFHALRVPDISIYLSNTFYSQATAGPLTLTPVYSETNTSIVSNKTGWRNINFTYTATGGENFLMIGSSTPYSSATTSTITATCSFSVNTGYGSYSYIDDVSVLQLTPEILGGTNCAGLAGSFSLSCVPSGTASYFWQWGDGNTTTTSSTTQNHTYASSGIYSVTLTTTSGTNTYVSNATVSIGAPPTLTITPSANSVCPGATVSLTASGASSTYTWLPGTSTVNPLVVTPTVNTTYTALGTAANLCPMTKTITIYTYTNVISVSATAATICAGQTVTLSASGGNTYSWTPSGSTSSSISVSPSTTANYTLTGLTTPNNCPQTKTLTIIVNPVPVLTITPVPTNTICAGVTVTLTATGATSYTWVPSPVSASIAVTPASNTTYTVNGTNSFNCVSIKTISVVVNPIPTINCSTNKPMVCEGSNATLTATGASTYTWNPGSLTGASVVVTPPATFTTNYTVTGTSAAGCTNSCVVTQSVFLNGTSFFNVVASPTMICNSPASNSTLTASGSPNTYTWLPSTPGSSIVVSAAGIYSVSSTNSLGCLGTKTVEVLDTDGTAAFSGLPVICGIETLTLSNYINPIGGGSTYTVNGTPITGSTYTFSSAAGSYTVGYTYTAGILCNNTATAVITTNTACCTSTLSQITSTAISGMTINGDKVINQDITITNTSTFQDGDFLLAPGVKIIVATGQELHLVGAHLYACQNKMWKGIEVQSPYAIVTAQPSGITGMSTFIEDAEIAINVLPITSYTTPYAPVEVSNTIFNKNYIAINIHTVNVSSDLQIHFQENVITCRTLTFTAGTGSLNVWPTTSTVSPGLRYAPSTATTGMASPYSLQSAATTTCLAPFANKPSNTGFSLTAVGAGNTSYGLEIGESGASTDPTDFNLFDNLLYGVYANQSNVSVINNVFQNTRLVSGRSTTYGSAIYFTTNNNYFYKLNLTNTASSYSATPDVGNRFWDCYRAVEAYKAYQFNMDYNTVRSTQSTSGGTVFAIGNTGVYLNTNRFSYYINKNEFTNLRYPINIPIITGTWDAGSGNTSGIYAHNLAVINNSIAGTSTVTGSYVGDAITVTSPNAVTWYKVANTALSINTNTINTAYRGINVSGMNSYSTSITSNSITNLTNDLVYSASQYGIKLTSTQNAAIVTTNTLSAVNNTNTAISMVYIGSNSGSSSPSVTCNNLNSGYRGFEFNSGNTGTIWKGNIMNGHQNGMALTNTAVIGAQGSTVSPSGNQWSTSTSWTGSNYGTWVETGSDAVNSKLYVTNSSPYQPPNNFGSGSSPTWYSASGNTPTTTATYSCGGGGGGGGGDRLSNTGLGKSGHASAYNFNSGNLRTGQNTVDLSTDAKYIAAMSLYRNLDANDSIRNSDSSNVDFYNALANTSIAKFVQADKYIYDNQLSSAMAVRASVTPTNNVESSYAKFYDLYYNYSTDELSENDIVDLQSLANLCPGKDGAVIYSARALFNVVTRSANAYKENCNTSVNERTITAPVEAQSQITWDVNLFPNPTSGELNVLSKTDIEQLQLIVRDVSGKVIDKRNLAISGFIGKLGLDLANGVYFITISNQNNESITKKLVITK